MKRFLALLLAALMLLPFAACDKDSGDVENTVAPIVAQTGDENTPDFPSTEELGDISGDLHVLVSGNWTWNDFEADDTDTTVVETAIYRRNQYIKEKYNVDITNKDIVKYSSTMGGGDGF